MNRTILTAASAVALLAVATTMAPAVQAKDKLLIGATSASSSQYGYFVALSQLINSKVPAVETAVVETGATVDNLRRIDRRQIDMGLVTTNVGYQSYAGEGAFEGKKVDNRLLFVYSTAPQNVIVRNDSGVTTLAGLAGKRFNPGLKGSATEKTAEAVFKALGISADYVRGSTTDIVDAMKDNRVIGTVKSGAGMKLDGSSLDIATFTPIRVLGLDAAQKKTVAEKFRIFRWWMCRPARLKAFPPTAPGVSAWPCMRAPTCRKRPPIRSPRRPSRTGPCRWARSAA